MLSKKKFKSDFLFSFSTFVFFFAENQTHIRGSRADTEREHRSENNNAGVGGEEREGKKASSSFFHLISAALAAASSTSSSATTNSLAIASLNLLAYCFGLTTDIESPEAKATALMACSAAFRTV